MPRSKIAKGVRYQGSTFGGTTDAERGAVGIIKVGTPKQFAHMDH